MGIIDARLHSEPGSAAPKELLRQMNHIGVNGGGISSPDPENPVRGSGYFYEVRMEAMGAWTKGYEDRLFPILCIDPLEPEAVAKARDAVSRGVGAFKIIFDSFYGYEDPCMELLHETTKKKKPIMFHSGILWDGFEPGKYNRPMHWECLIRVPGLRLSLAHCAWPWTDEAIALYGNFQSAYRSNPCACSELYLDLTPGTPAIYRRYLLEKLLNVGYDLLKNIFFGTDCIIVGWIAIEAVHGATSGKRRAAFLLTS